MRWATPSPDPGRAPPPRRRHEGRPPLPPSCWARSPLLAGPRSASTCPWPAGAMKCQRKHCALQSPRLVQCLALPPNQLAFFFSRLARRFAVRSSSSAAKRLSRSCLSRSTAAALNSSSIRASRSCSRRLDCSAPREGPSAEPAHLQNDIVTLSHHPAQLTCR